MTDIINTIVFPIVRHSYQPEGLDRSLSVIDALKSLHYFTPQNYQTIVVDQSRPNAEFEAQVRELCDVHVKTPKNFGFAQGTNIGWRLAQGRNEDYIFEVLSKCEVTSRPGPKIRPTPYLTTCNDDVIFLPQGDPPQYHGWWHGVMASFERYDTAVCVNPMSPREPGWGYGQPGFLDHLTFGESTKPENIAKLVEEKNGQHVDGLTCWCSVFKASAIDELGMFDERFWPGAGEDYDFMGRIYLAGYRALASSLSWVYHWWGQSKDEPDGLGTAQPPARENWNKLGDLWPNGFDVWGKDTETGEPLTRVPEVAIMPL